MSNPMSTDVDRNFKGIGDDVKFTKKIYRDIVILGFISMSIVVLIPSVICNADKIDQLFSENISDIVIYLSLHKINSLLLMLVTLIIIWMPYVRLLVTNIKSTKFFRTRKGIRSFISLFR